MLSKVALWSFELLGFMIKQRGGFKIAGCSTSSLVAVWAYIGKRLDVSPDSL